MDAFRINHFRPLRQINHLCFVNPNTVRPSSCFTFRLYFYSIKTTSFSVVLLLPLHYLSNETEQAAEKGKILLDFASVSFQQSFAFTVCLSIA